MPTFSRYGISGFVWILIWIVVCIFVIILVALLVHHFSGASLSVKIGHSYLNIGVT